MPGPNEGSPQPFSENVRKPMSDAGHFLGNYNILYNWLKWVINPPVGAPRPPWARPTSTGPIPSGEDILTPEARMVATYARAMAPGAIAGMARAAPYVLPLAAASVPFASYAVSPTTRQRTGEQANQLANIWKWFGQNVPTSVPGVINLLR